VAASARPCTPVQPRNLMGNEASTVRVRQRALQNPSGTSITVCLQSLRRPVTPSMEPFMELSRRERPWSASWKREDMLARTCWLRVLTVP
jgi:hypothetical protein